MLKRLVINNYRSCSDLEVSDIGGFLVFVGKNGVGKTNIFRALNMLANAVSTGIVPFSELPGLEPYAISVELVLAGQKVNYSVHCSNSFEVDQKGQAKATNIIIEKMILLTEDGAEELIFERNGMDLNVGLLTTLQLSDQVMSSSAIATLLPSHSRAPIVKEFNDFFSRVSYNHLDTPSVETTPRFISSSEFAKWQKSPAMTSPGYPSTSELRLMDLKARDPGRYLELVEILSQMGIVSSFEVQELSLGQDSESKFHFFHWTPKHHSQGKTRGWSDLSFGTRRLINLFVAFFYQEDNIFMLEQPEDGIHAGLLHEIIPMLRSYGAGKQIFIASHSAEVMNSTVPDEVRIVFMEGGDTKARKLTPEEKGAACAYLQSDGPLYDFLTMIEG